MSKIIKITYDFEFDQKLFEVGFIKQKNGNYNIYVKGKSGYQYGIFYDSETTPTINNAYRLFIKSYGTK